MMQRYDYIMNGYIEPCKKGDFVRYDDAQEIIDQLRAEYTAYRQTALVEADCLRKEVATRCAAIAECYSVETPKGVMPVGSLIASEIRKEFGL